MLPLSSTRTGSLESAPPLKKQRHKTHLSSYLLVLSPFLQSFLNHRVCKSQKLSEATREEEQVIRVHFALSSLVRFLKEIHTQPSQARTLGQENLVPRNVPDSCCPGAENDAEGIGTQVVCRVTSCPSAWQLAAFPLFLTSLCMTCGLTHLVESPWRHLRKGGAGSLGQLLLCFETDPSWQDLPPNYNCGFTGEDALGLFSTQG